jgi:hypothetical protein
MRVGFGLQDTLQVACCAGLKRKLLLSGHGADKTDTGVMQVLLLGLRLAARAVRGIEDDEDDLFYDTGRTTQALMQALVRVLL